MEKGDVVVVSARSPKDYAKVHIPGAVNLWHKDLIQGRRYPGPSQEP